MATVVLPALLSAAAWGAYPIFIDLAEQVEGGPTASLIMVTQAVGGLLLLPLLLRDPRLGTRPLGHADWWSITGLVALIAMLDVLWTVLYFLLVDQLGPVLTNLLAATAPVFSVLGGVVLLRERPNLRIVAGGMLAFGGVMLASICG